MAARLKAWVCCRLLARIVGSNPAGSKVSVPYEVVSCQRSLRWADHSSRGVLLSLVCLECDIETSTMRRSTPARAVKLWGGGKR